MYRFNRKLMLSRSMNGSELSLALDTALFMGFSSTSAEFPVTSYVEGEKPVASLKELQNICPDGQELKAGYVSSTKSAHLIPEFVKENTGLEGLFFNEHFLQDEDHDCLPDKINFKIVLPENCPDRIAEAACNFAFRVGMEVTKCLSGILADADYKGNTVIFTEGSESEISFSEDEYSHVTIQCGEDIVGFLSQILNQFPYLSYGISWEKYLRELKNSLVLKNLDGQLSFAKSVYEKEKQPIQVYCEPSCEHIEEKVKELIPEAEFVNYKGLKKAYTQEFDIDWEKDVFHHILEEKIYPQVKKGDKVEIYGSLSENFEVRNGLCGEVSRELEAIGVQTPKVQVTCAYKQGFSWIEDYVIPEIQGLGARKIKIQFKAFLPEGQTEWADEDGATPSYTNIGGDTPDKWYDLPIRFLQELYPVDDLIAEKLGISYDDVEFSVYEGDEDITYDLVALDGDGKELYRSAYKVNVNERPYLSEYPGMGKVHPATGYIKAVVNGKTIACEKVKTDIECIWEKFNGEVLTKCREHVEQKGADHLTAEDQPFFSQLRLEAYISEPERQLSSRQDLISPLDALHEDMYFVATDYFKNVGMECCQEAFDAPGLILPVLHVREGKPSFTATMYDKIAEKPCVVSNGKTYTLPTGNVSVKLMGLSAVAGGVSARISICSADLDLVKSYALLLEKGVLHVNDFMKGVHEIVFEVDGKKVTAHLPEYKEIEKTACISDIPMPEDRVIGYTEYIQIMEQLKKVPGIEVYEAGRSYSDRIIYAVDLLAAGESGYVSRTKRLTMHPAQVVICRHHANEVSSTNACFKILREVLTNSDYSDLGDKVNLTFIPVENTDGTAIHEELSKENPLWKFHVARFDALSKEFFREVFTKDTIHTEALAFRDLYEEKLPDLVVDNHGVPSHEWEQQYSGYSSPSFKGFWLPRSILYGYFWTVNEKEYSDNLILAKEIEHRVAVDIGKDKEMTDLNIEMAARFEKYAHNWMPKLFPANYYMNMINYWISRDFDMSQRYVSQRHPWITTTYYTSEVADETAQGDYLRLCTKAHFTHNMAILNMMKNVKTVAESKTTFDGTTLSLSYIRQRPIVV